MTTGEILLKGLVKALRTHNVLHNEEMASVIDAEIRSATDLECLINALPDELAHTPASHLGDPDVMSPAAIQTWIRERKAGFQMH